MSATKWASYSGGIRTGKCKSDDMVTAVAVQIDIPSPFPMLNRIDIQYGCPDRLTEYDQAVALEANYLKRGKALCGPTKQLAERLAVAAKLSEPGPLTDAEILSAVCE